MSDEAKELNWHLFRKECILTTKETLPIATPELATVVFESRSYTFPHSTIPLCYGGS